MSFVIDETHLFSGLDGIFNDKPNYKFRDKFEDAIDEMLLKKNTISVDGSKIKVELFHSGVSPEEFAKIKTVINDTFKVCKGYNMVPKDVDTNFRMFLFENRDQYVDILKSSYSYDAKSTIGVAFSHDAQNTAGVAFSQYKGPLASADLLMYHSPGKEHPSDHINYFTLAHEFVHCMQHLVKNKDVRSSKSVTEGMANALASKALGQEIDAVYDREAIQKSTKVLKSDNTKLVDIYNGWGTSDFSKTEEYPYITGTAMFKFLSEKQPTVINNIIDYYVTGDNSKWSEIYNKMSRIDNCDKFADWVDYQCTKYDCMDAII